MSSDAFAPAGVSAIACHSFPLLRITSPTRSDHLGDHLVSKKKAEGHMVGLALFPPQTVKFTLLPLVSKSCSCKTTSMTLPLAGETA